MNPFVFIVGCPRSGTTLLQRMVDAHHLIAVTPETHWIVRFHKKLTDGNGLSAFGSRPAADSWQPMADKKLLPKLFQYHRFANLGLGREEVGRLLAGGPLSYAQFVRCLFDLYAEKAGKPLAGDKTPGYARNIPVLYSLWGEAKFVHLIRDGRDVCLSALNWTKPGKLLRRSPTWIEDPVVTAALWWDWHVRLGRRDGGLLWRGLYYEVRYEELVVRPAEECRALCAFLGIAYDSAMPGFHEGRTRPEPGMDAKDAWLPATPGLRDWRAQMSGADTERFEAAAGGLLEELGYPRAFPRPCREALDRVKRVREAFANHLYAREGLLLQA